MKELLKKHWLVLTMVLIWLFAVFSIITPPKAEAAERWVVIGDGRTTAILNPDGTPGDILQSTWNLIPRVHAPVEIVNLASDIIGWSYRNEVAQSKYFTALTLNPKGVIIALGHYDWMTNQAADRTQLFIRSIIPTLKRSGIQVVCLTPIYHPDERTLRAPLSAKGYQLNYIPGLLYQRPNYSSVIAAECSRQGARVIGGRNAPIGFADMVRVPGTFAPPQILNPVGHGKLAVHITQAMQAMGYWLQ